MQTFFSKLWYFYTPVPRIVYRAFEMFGEEWVRNNNKNNINNNNKNKKRNEQVTCTRDHWNLIRLLQDEKYPSRTRSGFLYSTRKFLGHP